MKKTKNLIFLTAIFYILFLSGYSLWTKDGLSSRIPKKYLLEGEYLASQDGFQYYRIDGTEEEVAVSVSSNSQQTTYRIPENVTLEGKTYQVTGIWRSGFAFLTDLDITFPSTLKTIDYEAFFHTGFASNCREISLPYTLEGLGCAAFFNTDIENLVFLDGQASDIGTCPTSEEQPQEEGVTTISHLSSISPFTFARCTKLKTVTFSSSLRTIGEEAFEHCQSLTNLAFLSGLETIKSRAFSCCYSLSQVYLPNALFMKTDEAAIGPFAFAYCNTNLNIQAAYDGEIPDTFGSKNPDWNRINEYKDGTYKVTAVKGDMYIENVWLYQDDGSEVRIRKYLGESKENIAFPETIRNHKVTTIDSDCFSLLTKKKGIKRIFLPKTLTEIPDGLFSSDFTDLTYIGALQGDNCYTIPKEDNIIDLARLSQLETIGEKAFNANRDGFNTLSLPGNLKEIRKQAFQDLKNIRNFSIQPRTDTSSFIIGEKAFFQLGLNAEKPQVDLTLPQETITISANAFANSNCLRSLTIEGNGSIKLDVLDNAFAGCINLDKVTIEERSGKIGIGDNAFGLAYGNSPVDYSYSPNLQFTYLSKNAIVSKSAFSRQLRAVLYFQGDTEYLPDSSFLEQVKDKNSNGIDYLHTTASTLFGFSLIPPVYKNTGLAKTGNGYLIYDQGRNASSNVDDCTYLLYEEDGIKKAILTRYRFNMLDDSDSTALEVTVPQTVDYLGNTYKVTSIGDNAFACSDGYQNGKSRTIRKINLPDTIETIGNYAFFRMAGLEEINMPASLKSVGELAFAFTGIQQIKELNSDTEFLKKDKTSAFSDFRTSSPFLNCPDLRKITLNRKTTTRLRSDSKKLTDANGNILTVYPKYDGTDKDFVSSKFYFGAYKGVTWIQDLTISASDFPTSGASQLPQSLFTGFQSKDDIRKNLTFQGSSATLEALDHLSPLKVLTLKTDKQGNLSFPENSFLNTSISIIRIPYSENGTIPSYFLKGITSSDSKLIFQVQQGKEGTYNNGGDMALTYPSMATYGLLDFGDASGYKTIQKFAFQGISDIKDLILPDTLSSVEDYAFNSCPNLSNVTFKGTDITLGSHSFSQNSNLVSINTIRNGELIENLIDTRSIGFAAFFSDKKLTSIRIGAHVMDFKGTDNRAFKGCDRLSDVGFEETDTPLKLNDWAFQSCFRLTREPSIFQRDLLFWVLRPS